MGIWLYPLHAAGQTRIPTTALWGVAGSLKCGKRECPKQFFSQPSVILDFQHDPCASSVHTACYMTLRSAHTVPTVFRTFKKIGKPKMQSVESVPSCEPTGVSSAFFLGEKGGNFVNSKKPRANIKIGTARPTAAISGYTACAAPRVAYRECCIDAERPAEVRLAIRNVEVSPIG
jgi:hypothetical protein